MKSRESISFKLLLFLVVFSVLGIATFFFISWWTQYSFFESFYKEKGESIAISLDSGIGLNDLKDTEKLQNTINKYIFLKPEIVELTINLLNKNGGLKTVASSNPGVVGLKSNEDNVSVSKNGQMLSKNIIFPDGDPGFRIISPIQISGEIMGTYEIHLSMERSLAEFERRMVFYFGGLLFTLVISVLLFWLFFRKILIVPIENLVKDAEEIGRGNLTKRVTVKSRDEFGRLGLAFNLAADKLYESYRGLEQKVKERTLELDNNLKIVEKQNKSLEEDKSAMLNILEDEKLLEEDLRQEKAGVEKKVEERTKELVAAKEKISEGWLQLQKEKAKLSASIENMPVGFILVDVLGNLLVANTIAQKILGAENSLDVLSRLTTLLKDKIDLKTYFRNCSEKTAALRYSNLSLADGRFLKISFSPILTDENNTEKCIGIVVLLEDITEAKVIERSRDEFFSIASHELRTPLTAIRGNTSLIEQYYGEQLKDQELKDMIADIHESSSRLIDIVNDFLDISRLEQGKIEFKKEVVDVAGLAEDVIKGFQVTGSQRKIALEFKKETGVLPRVFADPDKVKQVLINLVGNSIKFTEKGGVTVTTQALPGFLKVFVTDTGRGISAANQSLLFHKFQQAGSSLLTRDTTKGTGLGLYISKLIIEGMGGQIRLESSEVGKGSIFSFTLPLAAKERQNENRKVVNKIGVKLSSQTGLTNQTVPSQSTNPKNTVPLVKQ